MPASVDSKQLKQTISPLDATLTKNQGGGGKLWLTRNPTKDSLAVVFTVWVSNLVFVSLDYND